MSISELDMKVKELRELKRMADELAGEIEALQDGIKAHMMEQKEPEEWENFGNARGIRNLFEKFIMNQANRLVMVSNPSMEELTTIKKEDVYV